MNISGYHDEDEFEKIFAFNDQYTECDCWMDLLHTRADLLSEEERLGLQAHLDECSGCRTEYEFTQKLFLVMECEKSPRDTCIAEQNKQKLFSYYEELYGQSPSVPLSAESAMQFSPSQDPEQPKRGLPQSEKEKPIIPIPVSLSTSHPEPIGLAAMVQHKPDTARVFDNGGGAVSLSEHHWHEHIFHLPELRTQVVIGRLRKKIGLPTWCFFLLALIICAVGVGWLATLTPQSTYEVTIRPTSTPAPPRDVSVQIQSPLAWVHTVVWSPKIYPNGGRVIALLWSDNITQVWSVDQQRELFHVEVGWGQGLAFSPDGRYLATAGEDGTFELLNVEKCITDSALCRPDLIFTDFSVVINALSWSPDGNYIASANSDDTVSLWDAHTAQKIYTYPVIQNETDKESHQYSAVAWSPDGTRIVTGDDRGKVRIWEAKPDGKLLVTCHGYNGADSITSLSWSHDSSSVVSGGFHGFASIWNAKTGQLQTTLSQEGNPGNKVSTNNPIYGVAWSPQKPYAIALASYNLIQLYLPNGTLIKTYNLLQDVKQPDENDILDEMFSVAWSSDGKWLAVGGQRMVLKVDFREVKS